MIDALKNWWDTAVYIVPHDDQVYLTSRRGRVLRIPARILVADPSYRVIAYGTQARQVEYAGVEHSKVLNPFTPDEVQDEVGARLLLRALIWEALGSRFVLKPTIHLTLPPTTTPFMRELWQRVLFGAGARQVQAWHPAVVAAAAADLPYVTPHGYAVGWEQSGKIVITLLAFGHVQQEVIHPRRWREKEPLDPTEVAQVWEDFLRQVPVEFVATLRADGLLWVTEEPPQGQIRTWARALGTPVTFLPWANLPLGLRRLVEGDATENTEMT